MSFPAWTFFAAIPLAAVLDIAANLLLTKSEGFTRLPYALCALLFVGLAFTCLAHAVKVIDLSVAYAMWGAFGILGTSLGGWVFFGQKMNGKAWLGVIMLISGMGILHLA